LEVLQKVPHRPPFRFIDEISYLDAGRIEGNYRLKEDENFYCRHFPGFPITPGVILTEIMAQTGMVAFGIYLMMAGRGNCIQKHGHPFNGNNIKFKKQVLPGEKSICALRKTTFQA